jgi:hypothetical protein
MNSRKKQLAISAAVVSVVGIAFATLAPSSGILSKFTPDTFISAQNAATTWTGGTDNVYRARLPARFVVQLDALTLVILRKGANMTDTQFKTYLSNLSRGIAALGADTRYTNDTEVQNILKFLVYEIESTINTMNTQPQGTNVITQVATLINNTENSTLALSDIKTNIKNYIQANISDLHVILSAMIIAQVDPALVASVTQELGYRDITEQLIADAASANVANYLTDADGKLAAKQVKPTQAQVDAYKAIYGKGTKVVATAAERQSNTVAPVSTPAPAPTITFTDSSLSTVKTSYTVGEKLYVSIGSADPTNAYGCLSTPNSTTACNVDSGFTKLLTPGGIYSMNGTDKIVLRDGFDTTGYPLGIYTFWTRNGTTGAKSVLSFTLVPATTATATTATATVASTGTPTCGTASRKTFASTPSVNLCATGTPSVVRPDGTSAFSWSCTGSENKIQYCFAYNGEWYTNIVNGWWVAACNAQVLQNYGTQKHTCSIGWWCALNGLPVSASNPSANPQHAGLCVKTSDWNKAY